MKRAKTMRFRFSTLFPLAGIVALGGSGRAQDFNIDVADLTGSPTPLYGAAAGQAGFWNVLTGGPPYAATINDLSNTPTSVTTSVVAVGNGLGDFSFNEPNTVGDDEFLMDDLQDIGNGGSAPPSETTWTFSGLNNSNYEVFVYAWAPDNAAYISFVSECNSGVATMVGGAWPGGFAEGTTHAVLTAAVTGNTLAICVDSGGLGGNFSSVNGFQFIEGGTAEPGTPLCFGEGVATGGAACGCGNEAPTGSGSGCLNSMGVGGTLSSSGSASTSNANLTLECANIRSTGLFFQAVNTIGGGTGVTFGDGIRCCGGSVLRVAIFNAGGGPATVTTTITTNSLTAGGTGLPLTTGINAGDKRCYQYWYRDPGTANPCGAQLFNLSNAVTVTWVP